jgi:hypothetical protein
VGKGPRQSESTATQDLDIKTRPLCWQRQTKRHQNFHFGLRTIRNIHHKSVVLCCLLLVVNNNGLHAHQSRRTIGVYATATGSNARA